MKISEIKFSGVRLAFQKGAGKKLNALVGAVGKGLIANVSGNVEAKQTADGWVLFFPKQLDSGGGAIAPFLVRLLIDDSSWKARVYPGTINGAVPVAGSVESSGGDPITNVPAPLITMVSGKNLLVLGLKIDLETHEILRSTVEVRDAAEMADIIDTVERTLIRFDTIAELEESGAGVWRKLTQARNTNLSYQYGTIWPAGS